MLRYTITRLRLQYYVNVNVYVSFTVSIQLPMIFSKYSLSVKHTKKNMQTGQV